MCVLLSVPSAKKRFFIAMAWFAAVQAVQLSWFLSHPYLYIYGIVFFFASLMGAQWGVIALGITPKTIQHLPRLLALAGLWTLLEWSRLFILSGLPSIPWASPYPAACIPCSLPPLGESMAFRFG